MELHNLKSAKGATKKGKRIARGQGSGKGGTATRGHKGAKSRSGWSRKRNHEGGQTPIQMRIPKKGFNNIGRLTYVPLNLDRIEAICEKFGMTEITPDSLYKNNIIKKSDKVKILGSGELNRKVDIVAHAASATAKAAVESAGGSLNLV